MKNFFKAVLVLAIAFATLNVSASAQSANIQMNALGSSAIFLELGLAASNATTASPAGLGEVCLWSGGTVTATDNSIPGSTFTDSGNAWVAWDHNNGGTCAAPLGSFNVYADLSTDSVVGNRCLFNGCTTDYTHATQAIPGLVNNGSEVPLPSFIAAALSTTVNAAATDIRPEDAQFAITRATTACGSPVVTGSQYLGLGYPANGSTTVKSFFSSASFNVVPFTLASSFAVTPLGATPIVVAVNSTGSSAGFNDGVATNDISSATLAQFLDGTFSWTDQTTGSASATGAPAYVIIREPLSGTYNTMEYNIPNRTTPQGTYAFKTSQDVGLNQPSGQANCSGTAAPTAAMNITTPSGAARQRAIGTGEELKELLLGVEPGAPTTPVNMIAYAFWSAGNFKGFTGTPAANTKYLTVDGIDPLFTTASHTYTGVIPTPGTTELANVTLNNVAGGSYPIWSSLRLVTSGSTTAPTAITQLANAAQNFVPTGSTTGHPDFVPANNLSAVHSHFAPPTVSVTPSNGKNSHITSVCSATEAGGDVGGVIFTYASDNSFCASHPTMHSGQVNQRK